MLPSERVKLTLEHQVPDRVPLALWGGPYGIVDPLYFSLLEKLDISSPTKPFRSGHTINYLDDRVLEGLGTDTRYIWPGASPSSPKHGSHDDDLVYDDFGQPWQMTSPYYSATDGLLTKAHSLDDVEELVQWPNTDDPRWTEGVNERSKALKDSGFFIIGRMVLSHGPFQMACDLRGMENFMIDMFDRPDFAKTLLNRITGLICDLTVNYLESSQGVIDMIELPGDDYAGNQNLILSPNLFRKMIRPCLEQIIAVIRKQHPKVKIMLHSDGAITKLIPDFIDMGVDVLHPLEPVKGMNPAEIKIKYGQQLSFLGGVDISHALPGSTQDVRNDIERCFRDLAPGGGYIMAPCNHLQADIPPENVIEMYTYANSAGIYH